MEEEPEYEEYEDIDEEQERIMDFIDATEELRSKLKNIKHKKNEIKYDKRGMMEQNIRYKSKGKSISVRINETSKGYWVDTFINGRKTNSTPLPTPSTNLYKKGDWSNVKWYMKEAIMWNRILPE